MIRRPIEKRARLAGVEGPLAARQAFAIANPAAKRHDADARCYLMTTGERINYEGVSDLWEFLYLFPNRRAHAIFGVRIAVLFDPDADWGMRYLFENVRPSPAVTGSVLRRLRGAFDGEGQWREVEKHPALPFPFTDSPEAVRALADQGEEFISGDIHLTLQTRMLPTGEAVWWSMAYGVEYTTPFAAAQAGPRDGRRL